MIKVAKISHVNIIQKSAHKMSSLSEFSVPQIVYKKMHVK